MARTLVVRGVDGYEKYQFNVKDTYNTKNFGLLGYARAFIDWVSDLQWNELHFVRHSSHSGILLVPLNH